MKSLLKGSSILITGANGGIAIETLKILMNKGVERMALASRTLEKASWAKAQLEKHNSSGVTLEPYGGFDMNSPASIEQAVSEIPVHQPFDIVFLQAGGAVFSDEFEFTAVNGTSMEKNIFQNALGGYVTLLNLERKGLLSPNARVVFAGGEGARGVDGFIARPEFQSVDELKSYLYEGMETYNPLNAIGVSKFVAALLVQKLAEIDPNRTYVWFSPGLTAGTKGLNALPPIKRFFMENVVFRIMQVLGKAQGPKKAGQKYVDSLDGIHGNNGELIGAPEGVAVGKLVDQKPMNPGLTNSQFIEAIWEIASTHLGSYQAKPSTIQS